MDCWICVLMLLACFADVRPYINVARFPSERLSEPSCNAGRDHRIAPSIDRAATKPKTKAARSQSLRSLSVGMAVTVVVRVACLLNHRQTRNRDWLASSRISLVLDLEDSSRATGTSSSSKGHSRTDPKNEPSESTLGRHLGFTLSS